MTALAVSGLESYTTNNQNIKDAVGVSDFLITERFKNQDAFFVVGRDVGVEMFYFVRGVCDVSGAAL